MSRVADGSGGFVALLREQRAKRDYLVAMLDDVSTFEDVEKRQKFTHRAEGLLAKVNILIRALEREIVRREDPRLYLTGVRVNREIEACRLSICTAGRPRRGRTGRRSRRLRTARRARSPGRSSDDDLEPAEPRVLFARAAKFRGDPRVALWLQAWGDELAEGRP